MFELFNPRGDVRITSGNLPHWYQPGVTYFVTFRTEDSIPKVAVDLWHRRRIDWLNRHGVTIASGRVSDAICTLPPELQSDYYRTFVPEYMNHLLKGHGACLLRNPACAKIVADSLLHFEGTRYLMGDFVVMPNHVHLLVCLLGVTDIEEQCTSWKRYTARLINRETKGSGRFWQEESFDHLVRSPDEFAYLQDYIAKNGVMAGLKPTEYLYSPRSGRQ